MKRRDVLKVVGGTFLTGTSCAYAVQWLAPSRESRSFEGTKKGMIIHLDECRKNPGCRDCIDACHAENGVASPEDKRWDVHWIRKVQLKKKPGGGHAGDDSETTEGQSILMLCNHCDNPPCAQVCPVQATFKREDGIVVVDHHRCIGCRYCMIACPYNARFFNFRDHEEWPANGRPKRSHGVAEACTLCAHRLDAGEKPACVEACKQGAILVDHIENETDAKKLAKATWGGGTDPMSVKRIRPDLGTDPKVYYVGL